ncbi:hypothetical protein SNOG_16189 [Parastagonospora nodorum SN15]|uniref:Uncharacterized protein n=1 Tax=Phaeosphaeria nodorum (strain SN15 / ATCC MYA-4574 / FGSC 10173) TaxID=321614 RepID=Q0TW76_PHANO|nr:hypothetical protein SNOG_16189 [Parastagonospora nodorum SN15]EAT76373.1 hypothetical protein SNOG_16189 [Parastagonospora nodorum SN15]
MTTLRPRKKGLFNAQATSQVPELPYRVLEFAPSTASPETSPPYGRRRAIVALIASPKARSGPFQRCLGLVANLGDTDQLGGRQIAADDASTSHDLCLPQGKEPAQAANPAISPQLTARNTILASVSIPVTVGI